jgi:hypothetical protein
MVHQYPKHLVIGSALQSKTMRNMPVIKQDGFILVAALELCWISIRMLERTLGTIGVLIEQFWERSREVEKAFFQMGTIRMQGQFCD